MAGYDSEYYLAVWSMHGLGTLFFHQLMSKKGNSLNIMAERACQVYVAGFYQTTTSFISFVEL